jgi:pimeloyl-ACP methyl ester carboxylesterase
MQIDQSTTFRALLETLDPSAPISVLKDTLNALEDPEKKKYFELGILIGSKLGVIGPSSALAPARRKTEVVVLLHGIRTHAPWQDVVAHELAQHPNFIVYPIGFEFLPLPVFWFPWYWRHEPEAHVLEQIRGVISLHKEADISVIAHSFGTYIISRLLEKHPDIVLYRLLLCGSIVKAKFKWHRIPNFPIKGVVNDVGTRDNLPVTAKMTSWGYGSSGTFGFKGFKVKDRFHDLDHSDFFTEEHIKKFWIPYFVDGITVPSEWSHKRPTPPWRVSLMNFLPFKSLILMIILSLVYRFDLIPSSIRAQFYRWFV